MPSPNCKPRQWGREGCTSTMQGARCSSSAPAEGLLQAAVAVSTGSGGHEVLLAERAEQMACRAAGSPQLWSTCLQGWLQLQRVVDVCWMDVLSPVHCRQQGFLQHLAATSASPACCVYPRVSTESAARQQASLGMQQQRALLGGNSVSTIHTHQWLSTTASMLPGLMSRLRALWVHSCPHGPASYSSVWVRPLASASSSRDSPCPAKHTLLKSIAAAAPPLTLLTSHWLSEVYVAIRSFSGA